MKRSMIVLLILLAGVAQPAFAGSMADDLSVSGAYVRALPPTSEVTSGYLLITNHGDKDAEIVGAASSVADAVEFHQTSTEAGMMKMSRMDTVVVQAHDSLEFSPGEKHLMLMGLKHSLKAGESIAITLKLKDQSSLVVDAEVRDVRQQHQHGHQDEGQDHHHSGH